MAEETAFDGPPPSYANYAEKERADVGGVRDIKEKPTDAPINVMLIGETQNGKSTLIRHLGEYAGMESFDIGIGRGTVSCTTSVGMYPIVSDLRRYFLQGVDGKEVKNQAYEDLVEAGEDDMTAVPREPESSGAKFRFNILDTPGLDDSKGRDMDIMTDIIGRVCETDYLNAIVYVRSLNKPFGDSFKRFFHYLQRSMPSLSNGLIIVHTSITVGKIAEALERGYNLKKSRKENFQQAAKVNSNFAHFFMDNHPPRSSPFALVESFNGCFSLLDFLRTQLPLDTSGVRLLKTPHIKQVDLQYLYTLQSLQTKLRDAWNKALESKSQAQRNQLKSDRETERLEAIIREERAEVDQLDQNTPYLLGTEIVDKEYGIIKDGLLNGVIGLGGEPVSFSSEYKITEAKTSAPPQCKWRDEKHRGNSWSGTLTSNLFRSLRGSVTFYATLRDVHAKEIALLRRGIADHQRSVQFLKDHGQNSLVQEGDEKVETIGKNIEKCQMLIEKIQKESFDAVLWPLLRQFYVSSNIPEMSDIVNFVNIYDKELGALLWNGVY